MTVKVEDENHVPEIMKQLAILEQAEVRVGIFADEGSELFLKAYVNEYGTQIQVTEKMRNYLHAIGLHLKQSTSTITIPERSYIRSTFDKEKQEIIDQAERDIAKVLDRKMSAMQVLNRIGAQMERAIKRKITEIENPPNHPFTIKQKSTSAGTGDSPLVDSGQLRSEIEYKVVV